MPLFNDQGPEIDTAGATWRMLTTVDLTQRRNAEIMNTAPNTAVQVVYYTQVGCELVVKIPG